MYLGIEIITILFGMIGSVSAFFIAMVLMWSSKAAKRQNNWERRLATANALALPLDQRLALRTALYEKSIPVLVSEESAHLERVVAGLEVAEHIAFCINNDIYDPEIAIRMFGRALVGIFVSNLRLVYQQREAESENGSDAPRIVFYELEIFVRTHRDIANKYADSIPFVSRGLHE